MPTMELLLTLKSKHSSAQVRRSLVLMFVGGSHARLESLFRFHGYTVVAPSTSDQAVALCLHNRERIGLCIIDESSISEVGDWSLARSLKMVSPEVPVLFLFQGAVPKKEYQAVEGVDCVVGDSNPLEVWCMVKELMEDIELRPSGT